MTSVSVGRRPDNDIPLIWDTQVSRRHALMERLGDGWVLVDDGTSRNGSYLNGDRVEGRHALSDGDVLRFGDTVLLYRSPEPARPVPAAPVEPEGVDDLRRQPARRDPAVGRRAPRAAASCARRAVGAPRRPGASATRRSPSASR